MATSIDVYQEVSDRITAALEQGLVPWRKPWSTESGYPRSIEGRPYHGINSILLGMCGFTDPRWGTFKAIQRNGGRVRKGERSTLVVLWKPVQIRDEDAPGGKRQVLMLRYFRVFNVAQADGIEPLPAAIVSPVDPIEAAEAVWHGYPGRPVLSHGSNGASYNKVEDHVRMPDRDVFESAEGYYLTLWHEATHSTGHESRLARKDLAEFERFGDASYSREELCAEMGSAMIAARSGIVAPDIEQSASYIGGWLRALRNDKKLVVSAAARARHAVDLIMGPIGSAEEDLDHE